MDGLVHIVRITTGDGSKHDLRRSHRGNEFRIRASESFYNLFGVSADVLWVSVLREEEEEPLSRIGPCGAKEGEGESVSHAGNTTPYFPWVEAVFLRNRSGEFHYPGLGFGR